MESNGDTPPFWSQPLLPRRQRHQPSSFLNPVALILIIPILILILLFFLVPPFLSYATQIIRPNSVKKGWDYFNVLVVLFAVLCGVFARRNDDASSSDDVAAVAATHRNNSAAVSRSVSEPKHSVTTWLEYPDRREYNNVDSMVETGMKRSSNSYPDLRQESLWENDGAEKYKYFDDLEVVDSYESPPRENLHCRLRRAHEVETVVQEVPVDKFEIVESMPPEPVLLESPPASKTNLKERRSYHSVPLEEEKEHADFEINEEHADFEINEEQEDDSENSCEINEVEKVENQPPAPPPEPVAPPPEPPVEEFEFPDVISETVPIKKSGATKEIASALASLYKGRKRKMLKKKVKSRDIYENAQPDSPPPSTIAPPSTPRPPPPPPPPPNVFQNLFKKSSKNKRIHSVPTAASTPPQPPPLPPNSIFDNIFKPGSITKRFQSSSTIAESATAPPPPPPPPPSSILNSIFKSGSNNSLFIKTPASPPQPPPPTASDSPRQRNSNKPPKPPKRSSTQYNQSTIIAPPSPLIPLPPPLPPFRMNETKFAAKGDFVRISSQESLSELEECDVMSVKSDGDESIGPSLVSCPSPDVNTKADNFIARLRGEWRLEKMNSVKENRD